MPHGEERKTDPDTGGQKGVKLERYEFMPVQPLREVARVYGYGAKKYSSRNWERGYLWSWSYGALQRHVNAFWGGEDIDGESGLPHLAHAVFHLLALMEFGRTHPEKDDRSKDESNKVKEIWSALSDGTRPSNILGRDPFLPRPDSNAF
jgi:hypothetical protein